jgi:acyl-CoA synthetase (AMP-forming)/AMP-acid ligase II
VEEPSVPTFGELIRRNGSYWPEKDAFVDLTRRLSWSAFHARTDALGHALRRLGVGPGDRVAVLASDCIETAETFGACMKVGAVRVGLNPRLAPPEIGALIVDCAPRVIFVQAHHATLLGAAVVSDLGSRGGCRIVEFGDTDQSEYERLIAAETDQPALVDTPHGVAMIAYTTGSTGRPKGAIYPHKRFLTSILYIALCEGIVPQTRWLHVMPAAGIPLMHMLRNIFHAAATVIVGPWDAERALHLIEREKTTNTVLVPTMLISLLESKALSATDFSSMRLIGYGSSLLPPATIRAAMQAFRCPFLQMFGTTELMGMSMILYASDHELGLLSRPEILASAGRPLPFVDVRITDDDRRVLPVGEIGELNVRTEVGFAGYWNAPEKDREVIRDGWISTGDMARFDAAGYVYLSDRAKFRIKTGGYNVFPTEIENILAEHPAVGEVAVIGLPDAHWGERIHAVVSLCDGASANPNELREFCRGKIADFKIPKAIDIWRELPKGPTGKIQKLGIIDFYAKSTPAKASQ